MACLAPAPGKMRRMFALTLTLAGGLSLLPSTAPLQAAPASAPQAAAAPPAELNVLHWWTSAGERAAADLVAARMAEQGLRWVDGAVAGGGGGGAIKVLNERTLRGQAPQVAQLNGQALREWAELGLLLPLDAVAQRRDWQRTLFPAVMAQLQVRGHVVAAPLGLHRINNLYLNLALFRQLKIEPPSDWAGILRAADALRAAGIAPVGFSDEPWQVATVFEAMLLGEAGPALYQRMVVQRDIQAFDDPALERAFRRLREWRNLATVLKPGPGALNANPGERRWTELVADFAAGRSAMLISGDWVRGELGALGLEGTVDFECRAVPGTAQAHLYSIDTLAMLAGDGSRQLAQERMAELLGNATLQISYNRIKGSVPVRRDVPVDELDRCAQRSYQLFANPATPRVPSLVHRMAFDEVGKNAVIENRAPLRPGPQPDPGRRPAPPAGPAARPALTPSESQPMTRTILLVDDDQKIRTLLKTYLEKNQYAVRLAP